MHRTAQTALLLLVTSLLVFGITMLYSTSYAAFGESILKRQLIWVTLGALGALACWRFDYRQLGRLSWVALAAAAAALGYLMLAALLHRLAGPGGAAIRLPFVTGPIKGSFRWLSVGPLTMQPSELAKLALILFLADYFGRRARHLHEFRRGFLQPLGIAVVVMGLVFMGKDLSGTVITGAVVFTLAFVAGVRLRYLILLAVCGVTFFVMVLNSSPERLRRVTSYRDPEGQQLADGYQLWISMLALGSGGSQGLGFTNSRMKQLYLPEAHTDFIVAVVGEELGFVAVAALVLLYALTVGVVFWIGALAPDRQGTLLAVGVGLSIGFHALVNIGVVSGFCPTTGVTAPFLSYGGSNMIMSLLGVGLAMGVARIGERESSERALHGGGFDQAPGPPTTHAGLATHLRPPGRANR